MIPDMTSDAQNLTQTEQKEINKTKSARRLQLFHDCYAALLRKVNEAGKWGVLMHHKNGDCAVAVDLCIARIRYMVFMGLQASFIQNWNVAQFSLTFFLFHRGPERFTLLPQRIHITHSWHVEHVWCPGVLQWQIFKHHLSPERWATWGSCTVSFWLHLKMKPAHELPDLEKSEHARPWKHIVSKKSAILSGDAQESLLTFHCIAWAGCMHNQESCLVYVNHSCELHAWSPFK